MDEEILQEIGLSDNEAKVYLALLELGCSVAGKISEKSGVHRTNVYDALKRLIDKGLVAYILKDKTKYFEASDPERLMDMLKEKEDKLSKALPQLALAKQMSKKSEAKIFEGIRATKNMLELFLKQKQTIYTYGVIADVAKMIGPFLTNYHNRRKELKIQMDHIYNADALDRMHFLNKLPYTEARLLPREFDSPVTTSICGEYVSLILWSKEPLIILIRSQEIANAYRKYFKILWNLAKKPKAE